MNLKRAFLILIAALLLPGMAMAQDARFLVSKNFIDDNDATIDVMISCNTGVPLTQSATITEGEGNGVGFVVAGFDPALGTCTITEDGEAGYTGSYLANAANEGGTTSPISCVFDSSNWNTGSDGAPADQTCAITNAATPIEVTITKAWNMEGAGGEPVDTETVFRITSVGEITGGGTCPDAAVGGPSNGLDCALLGFSAAGTNSVLVTPADGGTSVFIQELNFDSSVEVSYDCGGTNSGTGNSTSVTIVPGGPAPTCAFTNTVFFEGIPTLNQYGMAILALLMLGVGFVGFRRFA